MIDSSSCRSKGRLFTLGQAGTIWESAYSWVTSNQDYKEERGTKTLRDAPALFLTFVYKKMPSIFKVREYHAFELLKPVKCVKK